MSLSIGSTIEDRAKFTWRLTINMEVSRPFYCSEKDTAIMIVQTNHKLGDGVPGDQYNFKLSVGQPNDVQGVATSTYQVNGTIIIANIENWQDQSVFLIQSGVQVPVPAEGGSWTLSPGDSLWVSAWLEGMVVGLDVTFIPSSSAS